MNGLNGKPTEYPENALVPYPVILAASKGDPDAMKIVLQLSLIHISTQEQPENYLKAAEQTTEQNYNMIDGQINNTPTVAELEAKVKTGETLSLIHI